MICTKCKNNIDVPSALFCPNCGAAITKQQSKKQKKKKRSNGEGTVIKRGNTYTAIVNVATYFDGEQKKRKRITKGGFATRKEAYAYIPILKEQIRGIGRVRKSITFIELYNLWLPQHEKTVEKSTIGCYTAAWKHYKPIWYYDFASEVNAIALQECVDNCGQGRRTQENMKALGTMLFSFAIQNDITNKNYAQYIKVTAKASKPGSPFSNDDLEAMWKIVNDQKYDYTKDHIDLVLILCYTGFRIGELLPLKNTDFYREEDWCYFIGGEKTDAGKNRKVGVSPKILPLVERWRPDEEGYIFSLDKTKQMRPETFREKYYYPSLEKHGFPKINPHKCRHTFATLMKSVNAPDKDKMAMIGHTQMSMTLHYTHEDDNGLKEIANTI